MEADCFRYNTLSTTVIPRKRCKSNGSNLYRAIYANEIIPQINNNYYHASRSTPNLTNVVRLIRCDATYFPRDIADWLKQSADSIKLITISLAFSDNFYQFVSRNTVFTKK